jgi:hypothetical protein
MIGLKGRGVFIVQSPAGVLLTPLNTPKWYFHFLNLRCLFIDWCRTWVCVISKNRTYPAFSANPLKSPFDVLLTACGFPPPVCLREEREGLSVSLPPRSIVSCACHVAIILIRGLVIPIEGGRRGQQMTMEFGSRPRKCQLLNSPESEMPSHGTAVLNRDGEEMVIQIKISDARAHIGAIRTEEGHLGR